MNVGWLSVFFAVCAFFIMGMDEAVALQPRYSFYARALTSMDSNYSKQSQELLGRLGEGWSSDNNAPVGQCLLGGMRHVGMPSASISMGVSYSYNDVMKQLHFKSAGAVAFPGFSSKALLSYLTLLRDTGYSKTFIYRATVFLKRRHFVAPPDRSPLTWIGREYLKDPVKFRAYCGDQFIAEQKIGGAFYVALKFHFHTRAQKTKFNARVGVSFSSSLANLSTRLEKVAASFPTSGSLSVIAFQIGGDPTKLGRILGAKNGSLRTSLTSCRLDSIADCHALIDQILNYASQSEVGNFPLQFIKDDPYSVVGPGVLENVFQGMRTIVPVTLGPSLATQPIVDARARISKKYGKFLGQRNEIEQIISSGLPLSLDYLGKLKVLKANMEGNEVLLRAVGQACYVGNLTQCLLKEKSMNRRLLPVNLALFRRRFLVKGATEDCLFPYSATQYIYGSGGRYYKDEIFTLKVLTAGQLFFYLPTMSIKADSSDGGMSYQGLYYNNLTGYSEPLVLIPDR